MIEGSFQDQRSGLDMETGPRSGLKMELYVVAEKRP